MCAAIPNPLYKAGQYWKKRISVFAHFWYTIDIRVKNSTKSNQWVYFWFWILTDSILRYCGVQYHIIPAFQEYISQDIYHKIHAAQSPFWNWTDSGSSFTGKKPHVSYCTPHYPKFPCWNVQNQELYQIPQLLQYNRRYCNKFIDIALLSIG